MKFTSLKKHFIYTKGQRLGILVLFSAIIFFQLFYYFGGFHSNETDNKDKIKWLSFQKEIDLEKQHKINDVPKMFPFNPNFITDFKGYKLGLSVAEMNRLLAFRKTNKYVNSASEFQDVTKVSDALLQEISPYFKFPDWVNKSNSKSGYKKFDNSKKEKIVLIDINKATQEDLMKINGIGPALSERILAEKTKFGNFATMEQMAGIWGLSPEVIVKLNQHFGILQPPNIVKIPINNASIKELMQFPYFRYALAKAIVTYRSMNGDFKNAEDLIKIKGFPVEKYNIISLYLEF
jgi:DNA uptake protein ComE-like DNA-binding protein